jgi:hypothetical protein
VIRWIHLVIIVRIILARNTILARDIRLFAKINAKRRKRQTKKERQWMLFAWLFEDVNERNKEKENG